MQGKLIEYKRHIDQQGQDLPEICNWKWGRHRRNESVPQRIKSAA